MLDRHKKNVLHHACQTSKLKVVQKILKYGGPIEQTKDKFGSYPSDLTKNEQIIQYLKQIQK